MKSVVFTLYPESHIKEYKTVIDKFNKSGAKNGDDLEVPEKLESLFEEGFTIDGWSFNEVMSRTIDFLCEELNVEDLDLHYGQEEYGLSLGGDEDFVHFLPLKEIKRYDDVLKEGDFAGCLKKAIKEYRDDNPQARFVGADGKAESESQINGHYVVKFDLLKALFKRAMAEAKVIVVRGSSS